MPFLEFEKAFVQFVSLNEVFVLFVHFSKDQVDFLLNIV